MVSKRQRSARQKFLESNPNPNPTLHLDNNNIKKKKTKKKKQLKKGEEDKVRTRGKGSRFNAKSKHPLREGCLICRSKDHIAKSCPQKAQFDNKKICLLCRERGHTLKHCPNKKEGEEAVYCYNCGGTGHRLSKCPEPIKNGGTAFAECFLCKERGHLSKNCPTNTHGIYPKGGSCKICGGLTHLAKDCPDKHNQNSASGHGRTKLKISKETAAAAKPGEQGQRIVFRSGDDLEDDFAADENNVNGKAHSFEDSKMDELSAKVERVPPKLNDVEKKLLVVGRSKKSIGMNSNKQSIKIVNFM